jgi:CBS domain-containing protein
MATALQRASRPAVSIGPGSTVMEAARAMVQARVGAVVVLEGDRAVGIFSERDVMARVVLDKLDPETTLVASVMTAPVVTILCEAPLLDALVLMREHHIRHLPVANKDGRIVGMLSVRHLLHDQVEKLEDTVQTLEAYASYDGASG